MPQKDIVESYLFRIVVRSTQEFKTIMDRSVVIPVAVPNGMEFVHLVL